VSRGVFFSCRTMWFICIFESFLKCISVRFHVFFRFISIFFWRRCLLSRSGPCDTFVAVVLLFPLPSAPVQVADRISCARTCRLRYNNWPLLLQLSIHYSSCAVPCGLYVLYVCTTFLFFYAFSSYMEGGRVVRPAR
jgi:hypothetical protein